MASMAGPIQGTLQVLSDLILKYGIGGLMMWSN